MTTSFLRAVSPLNRASLAATGADARRAPVRIVHLGLGAFHRAHQAWYTQHAGDGWGIAAFTGRSPGQAELLAPQDGLYALVERGPDGDHVEIVRSLSEVHDGADLARLTQLLADPDVGVVTLTITEAGYRLDSDGHLDLADPDVRADIDALCTGPGRPVTPLGRLLLGLNARRTAAAGAIAIVSCDNIPDNGALTRRALTALAAQTSPDLEVWIRDSVSFVATSVDRITPANRGEVEAVAELGWEDAASVVTEPFADWVLSGDFPGGRPAWENAGARFVDDISGWENRKLWLLNGAHTILAMSGRASGHDIVADAFADPACRTLVDAFWAEAITCLPADVEHTQYRRQLAERFANRRIAHGLDQIAAESTTKVRYRIVPVARALRERGAAATACAEALGAWITAVLAGLSGCDREAAAVDAAASAFDPVRALLALVGADLDPDFVALVTSRTTRPTGRQRRAHPQEETA